MCVHPPCSWHPHDRRGFRPVALCADRRACWTVHQRKGDSVNGAISSGAGTADDPWQLQTPSLSSDYTMYRDTRDGVDVIVCTVGKTVLFYAARCLDDLYAMLQAHGDWMELGSADEQKPAKDGTVEAWGRSGSNPIGGWYGVKRGLRGRFGMYVPPLMEHLGLAELEHNARNNRMRAI